MLDISVWIDEVLGLLERAAFENDVHVLGKIIYPRNWGSVDGAGPQGRPNSAREWAREGLWAVRAQPGRRS